MKSFLVALACAGLLGAQPPAAPAPPAAPSAPKVDPDTVVLTINGRQFTAAQYEQILKTIVPAQIQAIALGPARRAYSQKIVEMLLLSAEAEKLHLDQRPGTVNQLELQSRTTLSAHEFQKILSDVPVSEEQVEAFYSNNHALYETIHVRHILVRVSGSVIPLKPGRRELADSEALEKAKSIRQRLAGGEDFAKVAREESDDSSADQGGDLGDVAHGRTMPQFEAAAFALKDGELSEPVRTPYGYHIIQVLSHTVKPVAEEADDIRARLRQAVGPAIVQGLVNRVGFHLDEKYFGPDPAAPAAPVPSPAPPTAPK